MKKLIVLGLLVLVMGCKDNQVTPKLANSKITEDRIKTIENELGYNYLSEKSIAFSSYDPKLRDRVEKLEEQMKQLTCKHNSTSWQSYRSEHPWSIRYRLVCNICGKIFKDISEKELAKEICKSGISSFKEETK